MPLALILLGERLGVRWLQVGRTGQGADMDVAIVGASGACGRMIATHLLADRVLEPHERLQLVGTNRTAE